MQGNYHQASVQPQPWAAPYPAAPRQIQPSGLAIASLVISIVALLTAVVVAGWLFLSGAPLPGDSQEPLTGTLPAVDSTGGVSGVALADEVTDRIREDGGDPTIVTCPSTPKVAQGVVTLCHARIDGMKWVAIVYFEDQQGRYTLMPI